MVDARGQVWQVNHIADSFNGRTDGFEPYDESSTLSSAAIRNPLYTRLCAEKLYLHLRIMQQVQAQVS